MAKKRTAKKSKKATGRNFFCIFSIALALSLFLDRIVKHILLRNFFFGTSFPLIGRFVYFNLTGNSGAAFSMLPGRNILLIWASVIALGAILFFSEKISKDRCLSIFVGLIAGGILGNLYDRIVYGFVVDFIDLGIWPVFNIADSCITIGAIGLAIILLRRSN